MKPRLAVFTVKQFAVVDGQYWTYGGFGDYVRSLLPHFDEVTLACHPRPATRVPSGWYRLEAPNLRIAWLPFYEREDQCLKKLPQMLWRCRSIVDRADIVNARVPDYTGLCGAFWAKRRRKPLFFNIVDDWHGYARDLPTRLTGLLRFGLRAHLKLYCHFERAACRNALVFAQGRSVFERYRDNPRVKFSISTSHGESDIVAARDVSVEKRPFHVVAIGRCVSVKGHKDLIAALARLRSEDPRGEYVMTIAGEGPSRDEYVALARQLGISDALRLPGQLGRADVFALLDSADAFCLPSLSEGTPKVLLEAMARGVPVVATPVGGVESVVVNEVTGLLVAPRNPGVIAAALRRLAGDPGLRQTLCDNGLFEARAHTIEKEWTSMVEVVRAEFPQLWRDTAARQC